MAVPSSSTEQAQPLLRVRDLRITFETRTGAVEAVDGVTFDLERGASLGIVGESGSGKSVTARALTGLLPTHHLRQEGSIVLDGTELVGLAEKQFRRLRGSTVSMIFQDPMRSLNPTMRIEEQLVEALRAHRTDRGRAAADRARARELLDQVRIPAAQERLRAYPHELSGGMRQRVMIALALAGDPKLLIADEPTTALDVTIQAQILDLLDELRQASGMALILITHDLDVAAERTDQIAVMYSGRIVERAPTAQLFAAMRMPYTRALFEAIPKVDTAPRSMLTTIPGRPPTGGVNEAGCAFLPRCFRAAQLTDASACTQTPTETIDGEHSWRCWHPLDTSVETTDSRGAYA